MIYAMIKHNIIEIPESADHDRLRFLDDSKTTLSMYTHYILPDTEYNLPSDC